MAFLKTTAALIANILLLAVLLPISWFRRQKAPVRTHS